MAITIDARGLSCPQPVLLTLNEIKTGTDSQIIVLVDTAVSKENVSRAAINHGCIIEETFSDNEGFRIFIQKGKPNA